jgi:polyisoprenoid-binding protein YceI
MKKLILASLLALASSAEAAPYMIDTAHSEVSFVVKHLMISNVKGRFNKFEGGFQFDEKKNELSSVDVKIDAKSVDTNDKKRDEHLVSGDFLAADKNPTITFKSDKPVKFSGKELKVPGTLTIRGVAKPVVLDVQYGGAIKDPWGNEKVGFVATTTINRKDFGITWNKNLDAGGVAVGDEVKISIEGEAQKAAAKK